MKACENIIYFSGADEKFVKQWCTADEKFPDEDLQKNLDWACSSGAANCKAIQENQPCYLPNTVKDHASYAFNSYWQNSKKQGATCDFHGAAVLTEKDPSKETYPILLLLFPFSFFPLEVKEQKRKKS